MSELICHHRKPTQTKDLEEHKETRNVVTCRVGSTGLIWIRRKWYETKRKWCFPLSDECMCPFTQAVPMRSLDVWARGGLLCSRTQLYSKQIPCISSLRNSLLSPVGRHILLLLWGITLVPFTILLTALLGAPDMLLRSFATPNLCSHY